MEHLSQVGKSAHEEGAKEEITELESLTRGHRIEDNSPGNLDISCSSADRIAKTLIYGKERNICSIWGLGR